MFEGLKELLDEMILNKTFFLIPDSFDEGYTRVTLYEKGEGTDRINVNDLIIQRLVEKSVVRLPSFEVIYLVFSFFRRYFIVINLGKCCRGWKCISHS